MYDRIKLESSFLIMNVRLVLLCLLTLQEVSSSLLTLQEATLAKAVQWLSMSWMFILKNRMMV